MEIIRYVSENLLKEFKNEKLHISHLLFYSSNRILENKYDKSNEHNISIKIIIPDEE